MEMSPPPNAQKDTPLRFDTWGAVKGCVEAFQALVGPALDNAVSEIVWKVLPGASGTGELPIVVVAENIVGAGSLPLYRITPLNPRGDAWGLLLEPGEIRVLPSASLPACLGEILRLSQRGQEFAEDAP